MAETKPKRERQRTRYTVDLPCVLDQKLAALAKEQGVTKSDLLKDAVRLFAEYDKLRREGFQTGGWKHHEDGTKETVRIALGS